MEEFLEWFDNHMKEYNDEFAGSTEMYQDFLKVNEMTAKDYSIHRFKKGLKTACNLFDYNIEERRNKSMDNRKEVKIKAHTLVLEDAEEMAPIKDEKDLALPF